MAKRNNEPPNSDKAKIRVFFAQVEGNNDSIQEALKTLTLAMGRSMSTGSEPRVVGNNATLLDQVDANISDSEPDQSDDDTSNEGATLTPARKPRGTNKKDRNSGINFVPDLNFRPAGKQSLKEFTATQNPKNDLEMVLVVVYYLQNSMSVSKISPSHVMTAFKEAGKQIPADLKQTIRNAKSHKV